ncbi:class I SAM-dependent methyltransferase [Pseudoalteromonas sp. T1lg10]|uniref:class I SAM-dependent methyltransferase n=1 Tax=Pseudoalteromonas sp. T1lg10 TaxID=2077093 RepID=UPI000CF74D7C|nr:class I SAM-dependent methyltransferase [Pseudoalteromonas sp. T1lg10]
MSAQFYNQHASQLAEQYLSTDFEKVHASWLHLLKPLQNRPQCRMLDIGAGAGRDALYLAQHGQDVEVYAVEPAKMLAELGARHTKDYAVHWLEDSLPELESITSKEISFDLILLSAVWMHIPEGQRPRAIRKLANLLKPGGQLVISLRHGQGEVERKERGMYQVCADTLKQLATQVGLQCILCTELQTDELNRADVHWQTVVLRLPDDGSGSFSLIRHVALNDGKSATHKLALMRVLLRIADGHPGAVIRREDNRVILPAGLVALYWCHQYKDLIDHYDLYQTPNASPNMGFMKDDGWHKLRHLNSTDFRVGNRFVGEDARALHRTLSHAVQNIRNMPCKYITFPNTERCVFELASQVVRAKDTLFVDFEGLCQWGEFSLPEHVWTALNRYACWIEPVLVSEWAKTMASYRGNAIHLNQQPYIFSQALNWLDPKRTTTEVRQRVTDMAEEGDAIHCVWTQRSLQQGFDVDHCMPFSRWPNNDLWNLLPSTPKANNEKRDRLPSNTRLLHAGEHIRHWWQQAWETEKESMLSQRFFAEANLALPGLGVGNRSIDDLFAALVLQRGRLRELQQLQEW